MKISLIGPEVLGTREIGKALADHLGVPFIDFQQQLEDITPPGQSRNTEIISQIFTTLTRTYKKAVLSIFPETTILDERLEILRRFGYVLYLKSSEHLTNPPQNSKIPLYNLIYSEGVDRVIILDDCSPKVASQYILDNIQK